MTEPKINEYIKEELAADGEKAGVELEEYTPYPFDAEKISITDKKLVMETLDRRLKQESISENYPVQKVYLEERIGNPALFTGRRNELDSLLNGQRESN